MPVVIEPDGYAAMRDGRLAASIFRHGGPSVRADHPVGPEVDRPAVDHERLILPLDRT
jgi:hypothetical protein